MDLVEKLPSVSIIILNYNGLDFSRQCLRSVFKTDYPSFKIYFVDNGSRVNEAKILRREFPNNKIKIRFIRFRKNWGFVEGNNKAVRQISSKYIVFLNNDTKVMSGWLMPLVCEMEANSRIGACQPKILSLTEPSHFDYAGACGGYIDKYGYPFTRGRVFFTAERDVGQYKLRSNIFWASGVALMVRRKNFIENGMFDKRFFLYMEEIDFCWRLQNQGFEVCVVPTSIIYHKGAATAGRNMIKKRFYEHRNNLILLAKNYSRRDLLVLFPQRMVLEAWSLIFFTLKRDWASFAGQVWAHFSFWFILPQILSRRGKNLTSMRDFTDGVYQGSVAAQYFVFKKRSFSTVFNSR